MEGHVIHQGKNTQVDFNNFDRAHGMWLIPMKLHQWSTEFSGKQRQLDVSRVLQHLHHLKSHSPYKSENIKPTRFLNYSLTPGNTACADTLEWWMQKKNALPAENSHATWKATLWKRQIIFQTFILGFHAFFQGCIMFGATFSSISVRVSRYRRVSPRGVTFAFFRVSGASSISQPLGLCTTKTPSKSFKLLKFLCWFDGFAMLCS